MEKDRPDILEKILQRKREEIAERAKKIDIDRLREQAEIADPVRGFVRSIEKKILSDTPAVIAEIKKASPSKGVLRENFDPVQIARSYEKNGAACISVLTDSDYFQGSEDYLKQARSACRLPVIRKDFIIDPYQVYESRAINADCILLIVAALDDAMLLELLVIAHRFEMDALIEVHNENELARALKCDARLIGINNRSLHTFDTSLQTTMSMIDKIPDDRILVTESGIHLPEDVGLMRKKGVHAFLVGEAFMRAEDPGEKLKELFG